MLTAIIQDIERICVFTCNEYNTHDHHFNLLLVRQLFAVHFHGFIVLAFSSILTIHSVIFYSFLNAEDGRKERKNMFLFNDALNTFYFTVIWRRTYGKGPFR